MKKIKFRSLQSKIVSITLAVGIISVLITILFVYYLGNRAIENILGANFKELAFETSERADNYIEHHIEESQFLASSSDISSVLKKRVERYSHMTPSEIKKEIDTIEKDWKNKKPSDPVLSKILNNQASEFMRVSNVEGASNIEGGEEELIHYIIMLTDNYGALVAATDKPEKYSFAKEDWWKNSYNKGDGRLYIPGITFNDSVNEYSFDIITPVKDHGRTLGIILMAHKVKKFFDAVTSVKVGKTDHTMLVSSDGVVQFCPVLPIKSHTVTTQLTDKVFKDNAGWTPTYADIHYSGRRSLTGHAPIKLTFSLGPPSFGGNKWYIITSQNPVETYAPVSALLKWVAILGSLTVGLLCLVEMFALKKIARPIKMLCDGAERIGKGDLGYRLNINSGDEIEELSNKFNEMASKLKSSYTTLEQKTHEVSETNKDLALLYDVSSTMSQSLIKLNEILDEFLLKILTSMGWDAGMIHLKDRKTNGLLLSSQKGLIPKFTKNIKRIDINTQIYNLVIKKGEPLIIQHAHNIPIKKEFIGQFKSMTCIPLKSKDNVLGMFSMYSKNSKDISHKFIELLISVGNQLGVTIENVQLYMETERLGKMKSEFVSHVSHELRTPLSSIKSAAEILLRYGKDEKDIHEEFLNIINSETDRLSRLIGEILDLSKIETDQIKWSFEDIDIAEIIHESAKVVKAQARLKGIKIATTIAKDLPPVKGDKDKLIEVLNNLLDNAFKFTEKGIISIGAEPAKNSLIKVFVSDTGRGIPLKDRKKIFEPFYQSGRILEDKPKGTGLGLTICSRIVEKHKGEIWVESKENQGSTFFFTLPMVQACLNIEIEGAKINKKESSRSLI